MAKFIVYEVQSETRSHRWRYMVEAETKEQAIEMVESGGPWPQDYGYIGDEGFGLSGYAVREDDCNADEAWAEAGDRLTKIEIEAGNYRV